MSTISLQNIANSHKHLGSFFNGWNINRLIYLFDSKPSYNDPIHNIAAYIHEEHKRRGINTSNLYVKSRVHGITNPKPDPMCIVEIKYNKKTLVHLTIHLAPEQLKASAHGMIHLVKNIYQNSKKYGTLKNGGRVRLLATKSNNSKSLFFTIMDGRAPPLQGNISLDPIIQQEMDVLVSVLNKLFDEHDREHYVGDFTAPSELVNMNTIPPIRPNHPNTPLVTSQINMYGIAITRKNKGVPYVIPPIDPSFLSASTGSRPSLRQSRRQKQRRGTLHKHKM